MTALAPVHPASPLDTVRLHFGKRFMMFAVPLMILAVVFLFSLVITLVFLRAGNEFGSEAWVEGSRSNQGVLWSLTGFIVYMGVQSVSLTFPFALALGSTRRAFALGTLLTHALLAGYVTAAMLVLLGLEKLTNQWFIGVYLIDVYLLGAGDPLRLVLIAFLTLLTALSLGAVFGASWVRFGAMGPMMLGVGAALVLVVSALLLVPAFPTIVQSFELWWLAVAALVVTGLCVAGEYFFLRRASVR